MIKESIKKDVVLIPACGLNFKSKVFNGRAASLGEFSNAINRLIGTPLFSDCSCFLEVLASSELSTRFINDYKKSFKECNNENNIYTKGEGIKMPLNQLTKDFLHKNVIR